ncbi:MAG: SPOR domain-containing protein [Alphaproteobacteria bacterium]|nr:MAG: SPOR domain-containing protein [Alphaproteobacteria bacterium]
MNDQNPRPVPPSTDPYLRPPVPTHRRGRWKILALFAVLAVGAGLVLGRPLVFSNAPPPVIKADGAPVKERPEQPGGIAIPHQDKDVFARMNTPEGAAPSPDKARVLPAPEAPMPRPGAEAPAAPPPLPPDTIPNQAPQAESAGPPVPSVPPAPPQQATAIPPAQLPLPAAVEPAKTPVHPAEPGRHEAAVVKPVPPVPAPPLPAVTMPQRPVPGIKPTVPHTAAAVTPPLPSPPPILHAGAFRVQLASVPDEAQAKRESVRLKKRHEDLLGRVNLDVVRADLGEKGVYYRIQGGPLDEASAKRLCESLRERAAACLTVRP